MRDLKKYSETIAALALSISGTTAVKSEIPENTPIKIGVLDARAHRVISTDKNTHVTYKEFNPEGTNPAYPKSDMGWDHGVLVATAAVRQIRDIEKDRPIEVYAANAFVEKTDEATKRKFSSLNFNAAIQAIKWFKQSGVKVIVASFVGKDTPGMRSFMSEADKAGIVVVAPIANIVTKEFQYPALYPTSVSVGAYNNGLPLLRDAEIAKSVDFSTDGSLPIRPQNNKDDYGSSFAAARIAGVLSLLHSYSEISDSFDAKEILKTLSEQKKYSIGNSEINLSYVRASSMDSKIKSYQNDKNKRDKELPVKSGYAHMQSKMASFGIIQ